MSMIRVKCNGKQKNTHLEAERARDAEAHSALADDADADAAGAGGGAARVLHAPGRQWGSLSGFDGVRPASAASRVSDEGVYFLPS